MTLLLRAVITETFSQKYLDAVFFAVRLNNEYIPSIASIKLEIKKVYTGNSSSIWNLSTYHGLSVLFKRHVKLIILIRVVKTDSVTKEHTPFSFKVSSINVYRLTTQTISLFFLSSDTQKHDTLLCVVFILFQNCHRRCSVFFIMARTEDKFSVGLVFVLYMSWIKPLAQQTIFIIFCSYLT